MTYSISEKSNLICRTEPFEWYAYRAQRVEMPLMAFGLFDEDNRDVLMLYKTKEITVEVSANDSTKAVQAGMAKSA
jgi:hypothetical protein